MAFLRLQPKGIQVCGVHPSATKTPFMKRSIFRDRDKQETNQRQQQMKQLVESPLASQPEDVAKPIWDVVKHRLQHTLKV